MEKAGGMMPPANSLVHAIPGATLEASLTPKLASPVAEHSSVPLGTAHEAGAS